MRVRVDRGADIVRFELGDGSAARVAEVGDGVVLTYDVAGRILGVEVRGVDPATLHEFTVDLSGVADRPADAPRPAASPARTVPPPAPAFYDGPVSWDPEAEAAVATIPFFQRGPIRLAAIALSRQRGLDRVTAALLAEVRGATR